MASIVIDSKFPVGLSDIDLDDFDDVSRIDTSSNRIKINFGSSDSITFEGSSFKYVGDFPVSGTVKVVKLEIDDKEVLEARGLKIKPAEVADIVESGDYDDLLDLLSDELSGNDYLAGGAGRDVLKGYNGDDRISGRSGDDVLTGGKGKDKFLFQAGLNEDKNVDRITDFSHTNDSFQLSANVFKGLKDDKLSKDAFRVGKTADDKEDRILYDKKKGDLYFDRDGSNTKYDPVKFAEVKDNTTVDHTDFLII